MSAFGFPPPNDPGLQLPASVESVPSGAVSHIFQAAKYGIVADAVVDPEGNLTSGTDDTTNWLALIAALPSDKAVIRLHGISVISQPGVLAYILGFNTSRLSLIGDGPHTGFYLADNSNAAPLHFNTTAVNVGPPLLDRLVLRDFAVYGNGYNQSDPGGGLGTCGIEIYGYRTVRVKGVQAYTCRNVALDIYGCNDVLVDDLHVDTVVYGSAGNGVNLLTGATFGWKSHSARVVNSTFIDVPNEPVYLAGQNSGQLTAHNNDVRYRNLRPQPSTVSGSLNQWQNPTVAATAYSAGTNYAVGASVSSGGFNYLAIQASGPGNGGAVTPGSDQRSWWLQNKPLQWSAATAYVVGQCAWYTTPTNPGTEAAWSSGTNYAINAAVSQGGAVYVAVAASGPDNGGAVTPGTNSAVWQQSVTLPGGWRVNFTARQTSTNVTPLTANGTLMPQWWAGGPQFALVPNGIALEGTAALPNDDVSITHNRLYGRNWAGELIGNNGIYAFYSGSAGVAMRSLLVTGNEIRGYATAITVAGDEGTVIEANPIEDCASGVVWGDSGSYLQRHVSIAKNPIRLGGLGNGTGLSVTKSGSLTSTSLLTGLGVEDNHLDGGGSLIALSTAVLTASNPYTALPVTPTDIPLYPGQVLWIGGPVGGQFAGATTVTVSAYVPANSTSIPITSTTFGGNINAGVPVIPAITTLTAALNSGSTYTSMSVAALPFALQPGQYLAIQSATTTQVPFQAQVAANAPFGLGVLPGATTVNLVSTGSMPRTYAIGAVVMVMANTGMTISGGVSAFNAARNHVRNFTNNLFNLLVANGVPQDGALVDNRLFNSCGGVGYNIGAVGTTTPIRIEGGSISTTGGGVATLPTSGVQVRNVWNITPAKDVSNPAVPATTAATVMPIYDGILAVTGNAGGAATIGLGTTSQGSSQDTATITVAASATVLIPVKAGQKVYATYTSAPTWQYFAQ